MKYIILMLVTPAIIVLWWIWVQVITLSPTDDCMRVYLQACDTYGTCTAILYTYPDGAGHIEHTESAWSDDNVSGVALWCRMYDQDPLNSLFNSIYCWMIRAYYF